MNIAFLNGQFVSEPSALVPISDRGFLYGDGLFETFRVYEGEVFLWDQHMARLEHGAGFLKIKLPYPAETMRGFAMDLIQRNKVVDAVLRIQVSRGSGQRGYAASGCENPTLVMSMHSLPNPLKREIQLVTASGRVFSDDPLVRLKSSNKLFQVVARTEAAEQGADDALILNQREEIAETSSCNVFWIEQGTVCTPPVESGILAGVTRGFIFELGRAENFAVEERRGTVESLLTSEGVFVTSSVQEVVEVTALDRKPLPRSPLVSKIQKAYRARITEAR